MVHTDNLCDNNRTPINFPANQPCPLHPGTNHVWGECSQYQPAKHHSPGPLTVDFAPAVELSIHHWRTEDPRAELFQWHHHLDHVSFQVVKLLAELGEIPKSLAKVNRPCCAGCQFGAKKGNHCNQDWCQAHQDWHKAWRMCFSWPTSVVSRWIHCSTERTSDLTEIQGSHQICWPLLLPAICPFPSDSFLCWNHWSQGSIR